MLRALVIAALLVPQLAQADCETILATDSSKVSKTGDTMTGTLSMDGASAYITSGSSITGNHFGDGSGLTNIGTSALANSAVDTTKLATDAVTTAKIINGAVDTAKLATDAVTTAKILNGAVDTSKLASDSVTTAKIINGAIDTGKIATDAVTSAKILNGSIQTEDLGFAFGSGDMTKAGSNDVTGTISMQSGASLTVDSGATCTGLMCRVDYSSGTHQPLTMVFVDSTTYHIELRVLVTSGTNSTNAPVICQVNNDATVANYNQGLTSYPNTYVINNAGGTVANIGLNSCGTGAFSTNDSIRATITVTSTGGMLSMNWTGGTTCQSRIIPNQTYYAAAQYEKAGPWTVRCWPLSPIGWEYEAIVYRVGK